MLSISEKPLDGREIAVPKNFNQKPKTLQRGWEFFPNSNPNIALVAHKNSGKSVLIYNILERSVQEGDKVFIFCETALKDDVWQNILILLENMEIPYFLADSFKETDVNGKKINHIKELLKNLTEKPEGRIFLVFDDLDKTDYKDASLDKLLKQNRHSQITTILSDQYLNSLARSSFQQLDYLILFSDTPRDKLLEIYRKLSLQKMIEVQTFYEIYDKCTREKYNFLYIQTNPIVFRHNFNKEIVLEKKRIPKTLN